MFYLSSVSGVYRHIIDKKPSDVYWHWLESYIVVVSSLLIVSEWKINPQVYTRFVSKHLNWNEFIWFCEMFCDWLWWVTDHVNTLYTQGTTVCTTYNLIIIYIFVVWVQILFHALISKIYLLALVHSLVK